jgi:hypothetical protein
LISWHGALLLPSFWTGFGAPFGSTFGTRLLLRLCLRLLSGTFGARLRALLPALLLTLLTLFTGRRVAIATAILAPVAPMLCGCRRRDGRQSSCESKCEKS